MRLIAATIAIISIAPAAQAADPSEAFEAGTASFAEDDYLRALAYFKEARDAELNSVAVDYSIAVCHYKLGDYSEAAAEFSVIADRYPAMRGLAQYNLGLVALKRTDEAAAERHFRAALNSDDETVRYLAGRQLAASDAAGERRDWFMLVDARFGHDDNVLLLAEEKKLSLRYGRPVGAAWMTELQLALKESSFDELAEPRAEDLTELALQATRNFRGRWQLTSGLSLADNDSAVSTVVYERTGYSIGFAKQF